MIGLNELLSLAGGFIGGVLFWLIYSYAKGTVKEYRKPRQRPTETERAFRALHTMEQMNAFVRSNCLLDCSPTPDKYLKQYGPQNMNPAFVALIQYKELKDLNDK